MITNRIKQKCLKNKFKQDRGMKHKNFMIWAMLFYGMHNNLLLATLNQFGISNILPTHSDDNQTFDKRINEEIAHGQLTFHDHGRRTTTFTIQDILDFIPKIDIYFQNFLNHPDNQDPDALELLKLTIIDVEKAKKMLRPQDVTPQEEHNLRDLFNPIKVKINKYLGSDAIEDSAYLPKN